MFNENSSIRMPVTLTLVNGDTVSGVLVLARVQKLLEVLNKPEAFLEMETREGKQMMIARTSVLSAERRDERKTAAAGTQLFRKPERYDPHAILGLDANDPESAIRPAYLEKVKHYHPDQFAAHPLPPEVVHYLEEMFILVQRAYNDLAGRTKKSAA